jgi:CheY-like chemotaxis protein
LTWWKVLAVTYLTSKDSPMTKRILLADDDLEDIEMIQDAINGIVPDVQWHVVRNGKAAVDHVQGCSKEELPCLAILDYKMPILNAEQVLDKLEELPGGITFPKVVWSSSNRPDHISACKSKGANHYFVKPNSFAALKVMAAEMVRLCNEGI